jgi:undecaprenyl diphosphate synthase
MNLLENIDQNNIPNHLAIIMDGNGRWQTARVIKSLYESGTKSVKILYKLVQTWRKKSNSLCLFNKKLE